MPCQKHVRNFCQPAWNPIRIPVGESAWICRNCKFSARDVAVNSSPMMGSSSCAIFRTPAGTVAGISVHYSVCLTVQCSVYRPYGAIKQSCEMKAMKLCIPEGYRHSEWESQFICVKEPRVIPWFIYRISPLFLQDPWSWFLASTPGFFSLWIVCAKVVRFQRPVKFPADLNSCHTLGQPDFIHPTANHFNIHVNLLEFSLGKFLDRMWFSSTQNEIIRVVLLEHYPYSFHIIPGISLVTRPSEIKSSIRFHVSQAFKYGNYRQAGDFPCGIWKLRETGVMPLNMLRLCGVSCSRTTLMIMLLQPEKPIL